MKEKGERGRKGRGKGGGNRRKRGEGEGREDTEVYSLILDSVRALTFKVKSCIP